MAQKPTIPLGHTTFSRTSDRSVAETSTWQYTTLTRDRHPSPLRGSGPYFQQAGDRRPADRAAIGIDVHIFSWNKLKKK
jgi:hypothetical protein